MKNKKMFNFSLILLLTGFIGGGLFAIARSIDLLNANLSNQPANVTTGFFLFILLGLGIAGLVLLICQIVAKDDTEKTENQK